MWKWPFSPSTSAVLVLLVTLLLALCSLPRWQAHEAWHHGRYAQKDSYALDSGMYKAGIAGVTVVACPLCATTGAVWSMNWRSLSTVVDVLCSC